MSNSSRSITPESIYDWLLLLQVEWGLSFEQLTALTHSSSEQVEHWLAQARLPESQRESQATVPHGMDNVVPLISICKNLRKRYSDAEAQVKWLFTENADFGGNKPIDVAASSVENLFWVGYYLDTSTQPSS